MGEEKQQVNADGSVFACLPLSVFCLLFFGGPRPGVDSACHPRESGGPVPGFNPRPRAGGEQSYTESTPFAGMFQSMPPRGGEPMWHRSGAQ